MSMITVTPAYGHDYPSVKAVKAAWDAGRDFILQDYTSPYDGKPINKEDVTRAFPHAAVQIRFGGLRKQTVIHPGK